MHVFVTGATGWVGSAIVADLLGAGHRVTGLARTPDKARALAGTGAEPLIGTLDDLGRLRRGAAIADAVVHTAFDHDFSRFAENAEQDARAIHALGDALAGSDRPLLVTSGLSGLRPGATEADAPAPTAPRKSEQAAAALRDRGVRAATIRLAPSVHGIGDHGFVPILIARARATGVSAYVGEGANRWAGVHRRDAARLYRLALAGGATEPVYHAVAEEGLAFREIARTIGKALGLPAEARGEAHFGWFARMAGGDMAASAARTREATGWRPEGPGLLTDLADPDYYRN